MSQQTLNSTHQNEQTVQMAKGLAVGTPAHVVIEPFRTKLNPLFDAMGSAKIWLAHALRPNRARLMPPPGMATIAYTEDEIVHVAREIFLNADPGSMSERAQAIITRHADDLEFSMGVQNQMRVLAKLDQEGADKLIENELNKLTFEEREALTEEMNNEPLPTEVNQGLGPNHV
jgi:hypothetical protein